MILPGEALCRVTMAGLSGSVGSVGYCSSLCQCSTIVWHVYLYKQSKHEPPASTCRCLPVYHCCTLQAWQAWT